MLLLVGFFPFSISLAQSTIDNSYFSSGLSSYQWDIAGSPYYIVDDIEIMFGSDLIIDPGVQVIFQGHFKLDVKGSIHAIGNSL
jgi:hypothetical protein